MAGTHEPGFVTYGQAVVAEVCDDVQTLMDRFKPHGALDWPWAESIVARLVKLIPPPSQPVPYLRAHGPYEPAHAVNVAIYAMAVARGLGFTAKQMSELALAALFHDIGKQMPQSHPRKADLLKLPDHGTVGFELMRENVDILPRIARWVGDHHERLDGSGPRQETTPSIEAQILGICDIFDANITPHPERSFLSPHSARMIALSVAPGKFTPEVVTAFEQHVLPYPPESPVRLSDGTLAIVVTPSAPDDPLMPVIRAGDGKEYNLSEYAKPRVSGYIRVPS